MRLTRSLQTRLLLGFGLILALAAVPGLFAVFRVTSLNLEIRALGRTVVDDASTGTRLVAQVAAAQQAVDRYLQQPQTDSLLAAQVALRDLRNDLRAAEGVITSQDRRQLLADLTARQQQYQHTFEDLSGLISARDPILDSLDASLTRADEALDALILAAIRDEGGGLSSDSLNEARRHLRSSNLLLIRMVSEQDGGPGAAALNELALAQRTLEPLAAAGSVPADNRLDTVLRAIGLATSYTDQLILNLAESSTRRNTLINEQGVGLQAQAALIEQEALDSLTSAAANLDRQSRQIQQIVGFTMLATLLLALLLGSGLARQITRPLAELVTATARINTGKYDMLVQQHDSSEIGQLADAFNHMTATLGRQRAEVLRQQEDLARRNDELEQALAEVRRSGAEREALARTMRSLSVPVVPLLRQVLMVPLVGELDADRASLLLDRLLAGISEQRASIVILDVTGVPVVDEAAATWLLRATSAAALLGTRCSLVGIRPEMAESLVACGTDLSALSTYADMRSAVEATISLLGKRGV